MARVSLDHQPHLAAFGQAQSVTGGQGELDIDGYAAVYSSKDNHVPALGGNHSSRNDVASADFMRFGGGEQDIASANAYS